MAPWLRAGEARSLRAVVAPSLPVGEAALPLAPAARPQKAEAPELPTVADPEEAAETLWVPSRVLRDPTRHAIHSVPGMPPDRQSPGIKLNGVPLWGFTYKLVTGWLGVNVVPTQ